jgi:hypothetical protein
MVLFYRCNLHSWRDKRRKVAILNTHLDFVCITIENTYDNTRRREILKALQRANLMERMKTFMTNVKIT